LTFTSSTNGNKTYYTFTQGTGTVTFS
jgi:hypothetical protein